jgi:hypothetical protein
MALVRYRYLFTYHLIVDPYQSIPNRSLELNLSCSTTTLLVTRQTLDLTYHLTLSRLVTVRGGEMESLNQTKYPMWYWNQIPYTKVTMNQSQGEQSYLVVLHEQVDHLND